MATRSYQAEAEQLGRAIDCALATFSKYPPASWPPEQLAHFSKFYAEAKRAALEPHPRHRNLTTLRQHEQEVFTYFQEAGGEEVEYFWRQIQQLNLGYKRVDFLNKLLKRNKIRNRAEYEYAVDVLVARQQAGTLSAVDAQKLSDLIGRFESA